MPSVKAFRRRSPARMRPASSARSLKATRTRPAVDVRVWVQDIAAEGRSSRRSMV